MKNLAIVSLLSVITISEAFAIRPGSRDRNRDRYRPMPTPIESSYDEYNSRTKRVELPIRIRMHIKGQGYEGHIVRIKKELKNQYRNINLENAKIKAVRVIAKSKHGMGQASLIVGNSESYGVTIGGNPNRFRGTDLSTFKTLKIQNPSYDSEGKWQLRVTGNVKLEEIVVILKKQRAQTRAMTMTINVGQIQSFGYDEIGLKKLIKRQNPNMDLTNATLDSVRVTAKSRMGNGELSLLTESGYSMRVSVPGSRNRAYDSNAPRTYRNVFLTPWGHSSQGKWKLIVNGEVKITQITINMTVESQRSSRY